MGRIRGSSSQGRVPGARDEGERPDDEAEQFLPAAAAWVGPFEVQLHGGAGADVVLGGDVRSRVSGGSGDDTLQGGAADDWLSGDAGDDRLAGGTGNDRLDGGSGNDRLAGGAGDDRIDGGSGTDVAIFSGPVRDYLVRSGGDEGTAGNAGLVTMVADRSGAQGIDTLRRIEELQFSDRVLYLDGRNNAPVAIADRATTDEDSVLVLGASSLSANDWDPEGSGLSVTTVDSAVHGSVAMLADGSVAFTPEANFSGLAGFAYAIADSDGALDRGYVEIRVEAVADVPVLLVDRPVPAPAGFASAPATTAIVEVDLGNTIAQAMAIERDALVVAPNPDLTDAADPSVAIHGAIAGPADVDAYRFFFEAGERVIFDIDYGKPDVDTIVTLYDAAGRELARNDDYGFAHGFSDGGSVSWFDSYLVYGFASAGEYVLTVRPYRTGGDYVLNVSIDDATAVSGGGGPMPWSIAAALVDTDGSESLSIAIGGLPAGATLSAGASDEAGVWHLRPDELPGLTLALPGGVERFSYVVDASSVEVENGSSAHRVIAGDGDDVLRGGSGADVLTGGDGSDRFVIAAGSSADAVTDFTPGAGGDVLDLRDLLIGDGGRLELSDAERGSLVSASSPDSPPLPLVWLEGVHGVGLDSLLEQGSILV